MLDGVGALTHRTTDAGWPRSSDAPGLTHAVQHQLATGFNYNDRVPHVYKYNYISAFTLKPPSEPWCWARRGLAWPFGVQAMSRPMRCMSACRHMRLAVRHQLVSRLQLQRSPQRV